MYDTIGLGYADVRRPDPRIAERIDRALGSAELVLNVGAGTGSYEPPHRRVIALEPSPAMIAQRPGGSGPAVRGTSEHLPFASGTFDGALALLTMHHWTDPLAGLAELRRVTTGPIVVHTFDLAVHDGQWLLTDYLPGIRALDRDTLSTGAILEALGGGTVEVVPVPHDCTDGFCHSYWRRPAAYLDPAARAGISGIARLPEAEVEAAMARLASDLDDGTWQARHADLLDRTEVDAGYRLVVSPG